jgi:hypothetical protein
MNTGEEDALFQTETMAELCATQGRPQEAIAIYRRLLEGHPTSDRAAHWSERLDALEEALRLACGEEITPVPLALPEAPGVALQASDDSITVAWALPPQTPDPELELLLIQMTPTGVETTRRAVRLPGCEGRVAYAVPALHSALAAVGQGEGPDFVPLARSRGT